jgi:hypothetical protein
MSMRSHLVACLFDRRILPFTLSTANDAFPRAHDAYSIIVAQLQLTSLQDIFFF